MPDIFKALATIMAWILWIVALISGFSAFIMGILSGDMYGGGEYSMTYPATFAVSGFFALAAVVIMILRKKME
jgi:vacuolar-type H+-ATPase subunit I/STV1